MTSEWVQINVQGEKVDAYVASPETKGPHPGIVVAMHVFGVDKFVQGKCDELADAGYVAIAPYLFHRSSVSNEHLISYEFADPSRREVAMPLKDMLRDEELLEDMGAAGQYIEALPYVSGSLGVTGFCIGGRIAYMMAVRTKLFAACADFYGVDVDLPWGDGPIPIARTSELEAALAGFFGDLDQNPSPRDVDKLEAALKAEGKSYAFYRYADAQHAFNDPFNPVRYNAGVAADSWPKLLAFFDGVLKTKAAVS